MTKKHSNHLRAEPLLEVKMGFVLSNFHFPEVNILEGKSQKWKQPEWFTMEV